MGHYSQLSVRSHWEAVLSLLGKLSGAPLEYLCCVKTLMYVFGLCLKCSVDVSRHRA